MNIMTPNHYKIMIRDISEGKGEAFEVYAPAFNSHNFGDTIDDAIHAYHLYFESEQIRREKLGIPMPKSDVLKERTKQVPLRIPESVYEKISNKAKNSGLSFNGFVTGLLENAA